MSGVRPVSRAGGLRSLEKLEAFEKIKEIQDHKSRLRQKLSSGKFREPVRETDRTRYLYLDFIRVLLMMFDTIHSDQADRRSDSVTQRETQKGITPRRRKARELVGSFFRYLVYTTERISSLRRAVSDSARASERASAWIPPDFAEDIRQVMGTDSNWRQGSFIEGVEDPIKSERRIIMNWMHFLNLSEDAVHIALVPQAFSELAMRQVSYCLGMRALLTYCLEENFRPFGPDKPLTGTSGLPRSFDGLLSLPEKSTSPTMYLTKTSSLGTTGISIINNFCISLADVKDILVGEVGGIVFVPGYPTPDTLKTELYWKETSRLNVTVLYLADFCELFRIWDSNTIRRFLMERTR